jgi:hypothetical protein
MQVVELTTNGKATAGREWHKCLLEEEKKDEKRVSSLHQLFAV